MPPTLSLFIVGPGGSLHSRKASELAQDPFPQELYPPLKARTWQGTCLPVWPMGDQDTQEGAEEPVRRRPSCCQGIQHGQAGTCFPRGKPEIHRAGQHLPDFP